MTSGHDPNIDETEKNRLLKSNQAMYHKGRARRAAFVAEIKNGSSIYEAAASVGIAYGTYKKWRSKYQEFAAEVDMFRLAPHEMAVGYNGTFSEFRRKYFKMESTWFHTLIINAIEKAKPGSLTVILIPPEHGKLLRDSELVPTPHGFVKANELKVGDTLFGRDGEHTKLLGIYPSEGDVDIYRVYFSDGTSMDCSLDHNWSTRTRWNRGLKVRTTKEIMETLLTSEDRPNHAVPVCEAIQMPEANLSLDPWFLGYWLGNGTTTNDNLTTHLDDADYVASRCSVRRVNKDEEHTRATIKTHHRDDLQAIGVIGNKHIPEQYLWASESQRRELLAGLLDSDGYAGGRKGQVELCFCNETLANDAEQLIRSLGLKPKRIDSPSSYGGKITGTRHRLVWTMHEQAFQSPRKQAMWKPAPPQGDRLKWRMITAVELIDRDTARCFRVDNDDHLFLAGKDFIVTHNTTLLEDYCNFKLAVDANFRISYGSGKQSHSKKVLRRVMMRMVPEGPAKEYVVRFGPFAPQEESRRKVTQIWNADEFDVFKRHEFDERDRNMVALGMTAQVQGTRTDLLLVDDPQSLQTLAQTDALVEKFRQDWLSRPGAEGKTVCVGTRVGDWDFWQALIEADIVDDLIVIPAYDDERGWLWQERYTEEFYEKKKKQVGPVAWARNYMQNPVASGEQTFTDEIIDTARNKMRSVHTAPEPISDDRAVPVYIGIDPSIGGRNATMAAAFYPDKMSVLDLRSDQGLTSTAQLAQVAEDFILRYRIPQVCVPKEVVAETMAFQKALETDPSFTDLRDSYGVLIRGHLTNYNKLDDDLGVAAMVRAFLTGEIEIPDADEEVTQHKMGLLRAELKAWRPNVRGSKLRQDLVMVLWFLWLRWRQTKHNALADTSAFSSRGLPYKRPLIIVGNRAR